MTRAMIFLFLICVSKLSGQNISGIVINEANGKPVEFVNIGIVGKNVGTVSDQNGKFSFETGAEFDHDTLLFSSIGYNSCLVKVADLKKNPGKVVLMKERTYAMKEVVIRPRVFRQKTLGVTTKVKSIQAGFKDNILGYECGVLMKAKKSAFIKKVNINISSCSYDTIYYRLNIYKVQGKMDFENILREAIYVTMPKELVKDEIQIDLQSKNIVVDGDFLVTLEHVKNLGEGYLNFCAGLTDKTYFRKTSQGKWESVPVGISISVVANVEK